jgi:hypothetical protein
MRVRNPEETKVAPTEVEIVPGGCDGEIEIDITWHDTLMVELDDTLQSLEMEE